MLSRTGGSARSCSAGSRSAGRRWTPRPTGAAARGSGYRRDVSRPRPTVVPRRPVSGVHCPVAQACPSHRNRLAHRRRELAVASSPGAVSVRGDAIRYQLSVAVSGAGSRSHRLTAASSRSAATTEPAGTRPQEAASADATCTTHGPPPRSTVTVRRCGRAGLVICVLLPPPIMALPCARGNTLATAEVWSGYLTTGRSPPDSGDQPDPGCQQCRPRPGAEREESCAATISDQMTRLRPASRVMPGYPGSTGRETVPPVPPGSTRPRHTTPGTR